MMSILVMVVVITIFPALKTLPSPILLHFEALYYFGWFIFQNNVRWVSWIKKNPYNRGAG